MFLRQNARDETSVMILEQDQETQVKIAQKEKYFSLIASRKSEYHTKVKVPQNLECLLLVFNFIIGLICETVLSLNFTFCFIIQLWIYKLK